MSATQGAAQNVAGDQRRAGSTTAFQLYLPEGDLRQRIRSRADAALAGWVNHHSFAWPGVTQPKLDKVTGYERVKGLTTCTLRAVCCDERAKIRKSFGDVARRDHRICPLRCGAVMSATLSRANSRPRRRKCAKPMPHQENEMEAMS